MPSKTESDLAADYKQAGFGQRLGFGERPALIIVDMVMAYLEPEAALYAGIEAELTVIETLLAAARDAHTQIMFTNVEYEPGGADGGWFYKKVAALECFDRGSPLGEFPASLQPQSDELVFTKQYASAFFGTSLAETLHELHCDTVIIVGVTTSGCVRATALDALQNGFVPVVVEDACGDRNEGVHRANIFDLANKYADVVSSGEVLDYLRDR